MWTYRTERMAHKQNILYETKKKMNDTSKTFEREEGESRKG